MLVCPTHYGYASAIAGSLQALGKTVVLCDYFSHSSIGQKILNRIVHQVGPTVGVEAPLEARIRRFNERLVEAAQVQRPEAILVVKGEIVQPETIRSMAAIAPCIYWASDDPYRYPGVVDTLSEYAVVASFSRRDAGRLQADGVPAFHLPNGYSEAIFHGESLLPSRSRRDVSFVGARYPERERALRDVVDEVELGVWGGDWRRRPWRARFYQPRTALDRATMGWADLERSAAIYRSCPVNLNIHGEGWDGLNPRVFEIPGAGGFQICDAREGLDELFQPGREIIIYEDTEEMLELTKHYLAHAGEREKVRLAGTVRARKEHTLRQRMQTLLAKVF